MAEEPLYNATVSITTGDGAALAGNCLAQPKAAIIAWARNLGPELLTTKDFQELPARTGYRLELAVTLHEIGGLLVEGVVEGRNKRQFIAKCLEISPRILAALTERLL